MTDKPKWLQLALAEVGTKEGPGSGNNPRVQSYYKDAGGGWQPDSVPWCAAFVGAMLKRSGMKPSGSLLARSYLAVGTKQTRPQPGSIVVFARGAPSSGHVAFVLKDLDGFVQVVGGNQGDAVSIKLYPKSRVLGYRWPTVSLPAMRHALKAGEAIMGMTPSEIMEHAKKLYDDAGTIMSVSGARAAAKEAASLIYYLAKLQIPANVAKGMKLGRPLPKPRIKRKTAGAGQRSRGR